MLDDPIEENNIHSKNVEQSSKLMKIIQDLYGIWKILYFIEKVLLEIISCFTIIQKDHKLYSVSIFEFLFELTNMPLINRFQL